MIFTRSLKKQTYSLLMGLLCSTASVAQIPAPPKTAQSPIASNLGAYGNYPVSPFTGKPDISVNLHTLSDGNVKIPVALNYDATGVKPDIHPGWTGLNFGLSTTYAVVRTVKDDPDEGRVSSDYSKLGYFISRASLNYSATDWASDAKLKVDAGNSLNIDTEPDEYNFTIPGLSGKFYLADDGTYKVECDRPVRVELLATQGTHLYPPFSPPSWTGNPWFAGSTSLPNNKYMEHYEGFTVTDEFGTKYIFGGSDNAYMEYSMDLFRQDKDTWICNSWYLKSVTRHTGQTINFTYERGDFVAQMYVSVYNKAGRVNGGPWINSCFDYSSIIAQNGAYNGKLVSPIYLKDITADNFKVIFTSSQSTELRYTDDIFSTYFNRLVSLGQSSIDFFAYFYDCFYPVNNHPVGCATPIPLSTLLTKLQWRKLDKIQIQNGSGTPIKEFVFGYTTDPLARLMLLSVQEKSGYNSKVLPPYEFTYFTDPSLSLPGYSKSHNDHWGYNNGKIINTATDYNAPSSYGTTFRSPDTDKRYVKLGTLTQIKFPTGGVTKFWFEPHTYAKEVKLKRWEGVDPFSSNQLGGGLRIKEIHSYDNVSNPVVKKKYYYVSGFNPASPDTTTLLSSGVLGGKTQYYWPDFKPTPQNSGSTVEFEIFSSQSVLPGTENGMGSHIGYSQVVEYISTGGWTINKFTNFDNGYLDAAPVGSLQLSSSAYQPYNSNAYQRGKLLSEEEYFQNGNPASKRTFAYSSYGPSPARTVKGTAYGLCDSDNLVYEGTAYILNAYSFLPTSEANYTYDQDNSAAYVVISKTNLFDPATRQLIGTTFNDSKDISRQTGFTYPNHNSDAVSTAMTGLNIIGVPTRIIEGTFEFPNPSTPIKDHLITYGLRSGNYVPIKVESKIGSAASYTTDVEFLTYDPRGNLLTYKERNGISSKLEYYGITDVGKIDLVKTNTAADGTSITQTTTYDYKPQIGISSIANPSSKVINYEYDDFNRLQFVKNASGQARASFCYNYAGQAVDCATLAPTGSIAASTLSLITPGALPVTLLEFKAVKAEQTALLTWSTTVETNSDHFEIERSLNGKQWNMLGTIDAQGESSELKNYIFTDQNPVKGGTSHGENLYRLKMIDKDGTYAYSRIESVVFDHSVNLSLYPNPVTIGENLNLEIDDLSLVKNIKIFDVNGKQVHQSSPSRIISTDTIASGLYIVQITFTDGSISTHRIVKQ